MFKRPRIMFVLGVLAASLAGPAQALSTTNIDYLSSGTGFAETTSLDGVTVSLSSGGAQVATLPNGVRDIRFSRGDWVTWIFSAPISAFSVTFATLEKPETFTTTLGAPTSVSAPPGSVSVVGNAISGNTSLSTTATALFTGLNTNTLTVNYSSTGGNASVIAYGLSPVPLPAALPLLVSALGLFGVLRIRRRTA